MTFLLAAVAGVIAVGAYRTRRRPLPRGGGRSLALPALLLAALAALILAGERRPVDREDATPRFLAIATDVSLSMGAAPDPRVHPQSSTRMERARRTLLEVVDRLAAEPGRNMVSIVAFTVRAQPILVWDDNLAQVREVIEHVLAPGVLTHPGSDPGAALQGVVRLFDNLPERYRGDASERYLMVISDGESTVDHVDLAYGREELRARGIRIVALHVGSTAIPEGLPAFAQDGAFLGFRDVGGQRYSVPDPATMQRMAGDDPELGRYVEVADAEAVERIADFFGVDVIAHGDAHHRGTVAVLLALAVMLLLWFV